jgi:Fic family protein
VVAIRIREVHGKKYYYLAQTVRIRGKVHYRERYLGRRPPRDLEKVRRDLLAETRAEKWYPMLEEIRGAYRREMSRLPDSVKRDEMDRFGIEFTYNTNRIEGSSLSLRETAAIIERGVTPEAKPLADVLEARAHQAVFRQMLAEKRPLSLTLLLSWHRSLFEATKPGLAGKVRSYPVGISGSRFVPPGPEEVGPLLRGLFRWYGHRRRTVHPVELAGILHLRFETIHPFGDGNGRVGRLMMNYVIERAGFPMFDITYSGREQYYDALERSHERPGELAFLEWFFRTYVRQQQRRNRPPKAAPKAHREVGRGRRADR